MKIGDLKLKNPFFLAPMHQVNDIAFRILCKQNGCGLTYTWLINPLTREELILDDKPAVQIAAPSEKGIKEFIKKYENKASLFDFNLGCPAVRAKEQDYGAYLQRYPSKVEKILKTMKNSTTLPITVKVRKSPHIPKLMKIFDKYCNAIAIHPRTAEQGYSGIPDMEFAEKIKSKTDLPVIYSGDVDENNALEVLKKFDFVMIGRKAIGNPAIFSKLIRSKASGHAENQRFSSIAGNAQKLGISGTPKTWNVFHQYLKLAQKYKIGFSDIKFHALNFTKGMDGAKKLRLEISKAREIKDLKLLFER
ncbi:MAG: tRNA-dihydrouridine synthase family protein [Nanoarchaeota archaeon]|nr:tRNA-dihydrouridine synthase family protein [Nanoarchaeota archaeon]